MFIHFEDRPSDSPFIERVWRSRSERSGRFHSMATCNWGMVVTRLEGKIYFTVRGPETMATMADCPAEGEWIGVHFKLGTSMPLFPTGLLRDRNDVTLPNASSRAFYLNGSQWEFPTYDNIDTFVQRLVKRELLVSDHCVEAALIADDLDKRSRASLRTEQRRILQATGMTRSTIRQIERARRATELLQRGTPILQVACDLGYFDQAHLTRSLKRFVGQTPAQIVRGREQLSLLYKKREP
jgi:AraC-like DNA-binding protein